MRAKGGTNRRECSERCQLVERGLRLDTKPAGARRPASACLIAGQRDLAGKHGNGLTRPTPYEKLSKSIGDQLRLQGIMRTQFKVLPNQLVVKCIPVDVFACVITQRDDDSPQLLDGLRGRVGRPNGLARRELGDPVEHLLLVGEYDLGLVTEVSKERRASDIRAGGDVRHGDIVEAFLGEELVRGFDDALLGEAPLALSEGLNSGTGLRHGLRLPAKDT